MLNIEMNQKLKQQSKFCCPVKYYFSNNTENLVKSLKILPRVIIYKKSLRLHNTYESMINITNKGLYKRCLVYSTDSRDTTLCVFPAELTDSFLQPNQALQITVRIKPTAKFDINRRRHVFVSSQHPNIIFSIPIIILTEDDGVLSLPSSIIFPSTAVENFTFYEMILFNKSEQKMQFKIKCAHSNLTVQAKSINILRKDYAKILLKLFCKNDQVVVEFLKVKINTGDNFEIAIRHEPLQYFLFVDTLKINFECLGFKRKRTAEFSICNESPKAIVFHVDFNCAKARLLDDVQINDSKADENVDIFSFRHFEFKPKCATIQAYASSTVQITFRPVMHRDFKPAIDDIPPFVVLSGIKITWEDELKTAERTISLRGEIVGPEISISPAVFDLRQVYFGEEHCAQIKVVNTDDLCDAHVDLYDITNRETAQIFFKPKDGLTLSPQQNGIFQLQFFSTMIGKFNIKLKFKVKNGDFYSMIIMGYSQQVRVKCFPDVLDLGVIPIALPQKRLILLMNPLTVPITVQCTVRNDGNETPLVLNVRNVEEHLPVTINDPYHYANLLAKADNLEEYIPEEAEEFEFQYNFQEPEQSLISVRSQTEDNTSYSSEFERLALDHIPDMSHNLVAYLKTIKLFDKPDLEKNVVEETLNMLLKTPYFLDMDKYKNYTQMDWNSLATDPKEIYCNTEIIHLKPNTGKAISVVIIPNDVGDHHKYIQLRVCPLGQAAMTQRNTDLYKIVKTDHLLSKIWIKYNCSVPEVIWDNMIIMQDQLYAGEFYDVEMTFRNNSYIGGFFYYDVIPQSSLGMMKFSNNKWKYFIEPQSKICVPCKVKFNKLGFITLSGLIKFVGVYACYPYHIKSEVLPPKVKFEPRSIIKTLNVLEFAKFYVFITNATPTTTWFKLKLKDETCMSIEPYGGQLAPTGHAMYVTLSVLYTDPGTYKNVLYIIMEFETIEKIPITINVKGIPIFFEPEIRSKDINIGNILCNTEDDYFDDKPNYTQQFKVINKGSRNYRLSITRTKCSAKATCSVNASKVKVNIKPNNLVMSGQSTNYFNIMMNCCETTTIFSEFRIYLNDINNVKHTESYRFILTAAFTLPELTWNRRNISMIYYRTHQFKEREQWETIKLTNVTDNIVERVNLKITGPFKMKILFEHKFEEELNFSMSALETKELFILLNKDLIRNRLDTHYEGCITCCANSRVQKTVHLKLLVFIPKVILKHNQVTVFTKNTEGGTYVELLNTGEVPALYKWKKLKEEWLYISQEEDIKQAASIILSDLISMLALETVDPEADSETNMTRRYQKFKCVLKDLNDPINIKEILNEIIENIDLSARHYKLPPIESIEIENFKNPNQNNNEIIDRLMVYSTDHMQYQMEEALNMEILQLQEEFNEKLSEIEDHFNSQTVYVNRKYVPITSTSTVALGTLSNKETCVYYTLDHILSHLKLDDSYVLSEPSSQTCDPKKSVYFFDKCGLLQEKQTEMCALHIPPIRKGFEVRAAFQLDVVGGKSQQFEIILVNLETTVILSKENFYLGLKPWYEQFRTKTCIKNTTNYTISLKINQVPRIREKLSKLATGFINIVGNRTLQLIPYQSATIQTEGTLGFDQEFKREFKIIINESEEIDLKFNGHGIMPMLNISKPGLPLLVQDPDEIIAEYYLLQKIFYFKIFKAITEREDELSNAMDEEDNSLQEVKSFLTDITFLSTETQYDSEIAKSILEIKRELNFFKILQTYILINNNEDLPSSTILEQLLQTEKFVCHLFNNPETGSFLSQLYQNNLLNQKKYDEYVSINLKHFTIHPLPFQLNTYILDMGNVYVNQYTKTVFKLEFMGPGRLIAAARCAVKIPGLLIDFEVFENSNNFIYYRANDKLTVCDTPYRNMTERDMGAETNSQQQHQRYITTDEAKCLRNKYNSLNRSIYREQKYHLTHCKIFSKSKYNFAETQVNVKILFRPQRSHYKLNQIMKDFLFIDLHMGPTLPILLQARITDGKQ